MTVHILFCNIDDHVDLKKKSKPNREVTFRETFPEKSNFHWKTENNQSHIGQHRVPARKDGLTEELGSSQDPLAERRGVMTFGSAYPYYYGACRSGG